MLLSENEYLSVQEIADVMQVSKRTIYSDISDINYWLKAYHLPELEVVRGRMRIENKYKIQISGLLMGKKDGYIFFPSERVNLVICYIMLNETPVLVNHLIDYCRVSRNTIFSDLRIVASRLKEFSCDLRYTAGLGYQIMGETVQVRAVFISCLNEIRILLEQGVLELPGQEKAGLYLKRLKNIEKMMNVNYIVGNLHSLTALLTLMYREQNERFLQNMKLEAVEISEVFSLVKEEFPDLCREEQKYLSIHLLGSRINFLSENYFEKYANQELTELVQSLIAEFEYTACIYFQEKESLKRDLLQHLMTAQYRYMYGIQIENFICEDVRRAYPSLFSVTKAVMKYAEQYYGVPIQDNEVAYIALYFGAHLKGIQLEEPLRIMIVCASGVSTGRMLEQEIRSLLPYAKIVGIVDYIKFQRLQDYCDLIISSIKLDTVVPTITVHPILTEEDKKKILNHSLVSKQHPVWLEQALFDALKKYVKESEQERFRKDIARCILKDGNPVIRKEDKSGLLDYLTADKIHIFEGKYRWEEAIRLSGKCLADHKSITQDYLEAIIENFHKFGNYMFIDENTVLAHAEPEAGVNELDLAFAFFKEPVCFAENREAGLIIVLAVPDYEEHIQISGDILKVAGCKDYVDTMINMNCENEILTALQSILIKAADS